MTSRLLVEGGGDGKDTRVACRRGFRLLLEKCGLRGRMPAVQACGTRSHALRDFSIALRQADARTFLLVDSEGPVVHDSPWQHLEARDGWQRPPAADDGQCHLMVQSMEAWIACDDSALASFFGTGWQPGAVPKAKNIEGVPRGEVLDKLRHASRNCTKQYTKGAVSFELLAMLDPQAIRARSAWADRFFATITANRESH